MTSGFLQKTARFGHLWALAAILSAGLLAYSNSFQGPFVLDDIYSIVQNPSIRSLDGPQFNNHRYLAYLSFALNYHLGGVEVFGYHLVNLIIHLTSALLVYLLLWLTFRTPYFRALSIFESGAGDLGARQCAPMVEWMVPLFVALVFVVHPIQTQAVNYIVQRMTSMSAMFYLLSLALYVMARLALQTGRTEEASASPGCWRPLLLPLVLLAAATLAAVAAMKTKEIAFTLPLAIVLYEVFFFTGAWKKRLLYLLPLLVTLPIVPLTVIGLQQMSDSPTAAFSAENAEIFAAGDLDRTTYLLTQFRVIVTYLRLLLLPVNQNLDYAYPVYTTFFVPPVFLSFLLLVGLTGLAVYSYLKSSLPVYSGREAEGVGAQEAGARQCAPTDGLWRLVSFGILWFFLTLAVESSLVPIQDVIVEHRLYLPSIGFFMGVAAVIFLLLRKTSSLLVHRLALTAALVLVIVLGYATWQRNHIWSDDLRLWHDVIAKSPDKARPYNDIGAILIGHKRYEEAIGYLVKSVELDPEYPYSHNNLGLALIMTNRSHEAIPLLKKAIGLHLRFEQAYISLAVAFNQTRQFQQTVTLLEGNSGWLNSRVELHYHLGVAYYFLGNRAATLAKLQIVERSGEDQLAQDLRRLLVGR